MTDDAVERRAKAKQAERREWLASSAKSMGYSTVMAIIGAVAIALVLLVPSAANLVRVVVVICCIALMVMVPSRGGAGWLAAIIPAALLWDPIWPLYLSRNTWIPIDLVFGGLFIGIAVWCRGRRTTFETEAKTLTPEDG